MNNRKVVLAPLKPLQAYEDQIKVVRECKMREKQQCEQEENRKRVSEVERKNEEKSEQK